MAPESQTYTNPKGITSVARNGTIFEFYVRLITMFLIKNDFWQIKKSEEKGFGVFAKNQPVTNPADYVEMTKKAPDLNSIAPEQIEALIDALLAKGYTDEEMRGILGQNTLRVMRENTSA